ncbi:hypothetical protein POJ06DRAFT_236409 [Lipomyces tetrasporus]|uniref:Uncharacterized protein n=1 Tax=Lipomyces tetrasporus TaxID=54092 RepID=A0AAD7VUE4_9ASCO|nr:uncharacterized protein POJ06DRAFT_236409 [Lipomyces tetrasporus]KAJ8101739.1 hypothetical protein POJ06DRAFT_236409 [Lipomyces tetrasporus]
MADHSQPASFRPASTNHTSDTDNNFTLHLPPTSRSAGDCSAVDAGDCDDELVAEKEKEVEDQCPDCGQRTVRKCLIHADVALVLCVDKSCGYPFAADDIRHQIVRVPTGEILEAARRRMLDAGVGELTATKIAQTTELDDHHPTPDPGSS